MPTDAAAPTGPAALDNHGLPNPLIPGFHPDPSVCRVGEWYYLATSSFEHLPGIPIYRSRDLREMELIGHVATRPGQLGVEGTPTGGGAWAPTIRHHEGRFHLVVPDMLGTGRGNVLFTADDPAGPWDDGVVMDVMGIDPDLTWDEEGRAVVTVSGFVLDEETGKLTHRGITQVRIDTATGAALTEPVRLWSGTGGMFPEAPHLYHVGDHWYLLIAEGGTERGHSATIARGPSPAGPFTGSPHNPLVTARGTDRAVQNTGHGDLLQMYDGSWAMVLLGTRPRSMTRAFAPMGRETFVVPVTWVDGWPVAEPVRLGEQAPARSRRVTLDLTDPEVIAVRRFPADVADAEARPGALRLAGRGVGMEDPCPDFVGVRQDTEDWELRADLDVSAGVGGLALRFQEDAHLVLEVDGQEVQARMTAFSLAQTWSIPRPGDAQRISLRIRAEASVPGRIGVAASCDDLVAEVRDGALSADAGADAGWIEVARVDGRFLSSDVCESFTGRVGGPFARSGQVDVLDWSTAGRDVEREIR